MAYQTPITVEKALERIQRHEYVVPAIQREFVWDLDQVCKLFDSLLCNYPIGTFLFWRLQPDELASADYSFYDVVREYHEVKNHHNQRLDLAVDREVVAILDGQQRLTSLNLGLRGSYTTKRRSARGSSELYETRRLHLDLLHESSVTDDTDVRYHFKFLTQAEVDRDHKSGTRRWFPASEALTYHGRDIFRIMQELDIVASETAHDTLYALMAAVREVGAIAFFELEKQPVERVLDIFIRVNSGGTVLAKSDLLLSVATGHFTRRDARESLHDLVDSLNAIGQGFRFTKDIVLKTGLVITDRPDVRITAKSFDRASTDRLDHEWDAIDASLRAAANLLASFGLSGKLLTASSVIIPLADYIHHRGLAAEYVTAARFRPDREVVRLWVIRILLKQNVWGAGLNTLLIRLRRAIRESDGGFPLEAIESHMAELAKPLTFGDVELDDLAETEYRRPQAALLLSLLYPGIDTSHLFHVDHVFPRKRFTDAALRRSGVDGDLHDLYQERVDRLPNLQLLDGTVNLEKQAEWPVEWAERRFAMAAAREGYLAAHDLTNLPSDFGAFLDFYEQRRTVMRQRLEDLLMPRRGGERLTNDLGVLQARAAADNPSWSPPAGQPVASPLEAVGRVDSAGPDKSSPTESAPRSGRRPRTHIGRRLSAVADGALQYRHHDKVHEAVLDNGWITLPSGERFDSPTAAARAVNGDVSVNGWIVWARDGKTLAELHP